MTAPEPTARDLHDVHLITVESAAVAARLYVAAVLDEVESALRVAIGSVQATRRKYVTDLQTDKPFALLIQAEGAVRRDRP